MACRVCKTHVPILQSWKRALEEIGVMREGFKKQTVENP